MFSLFVFVCKWIHSQSTYPIFQKTCLNSRPKDVLRVGNVYQTLFEINCIKGESTLRPFRFLVLRCENNDMTSRHNYLKSSCHIMMLIFQIIWCRIFRSECEMLCRFIRWFFCYLHGINSQFRHVNHSELSDQSIRRWWYHHCNDATLSHTLTFVSYVRRSEFTRFEAF